MLAFLRGTIRAKLPHAVIVELHDVGYRVHIPAPLLERLTMGERVELYTREVVRDDSRECYGVSTPDALALFDALTTVSGVGPRTALGILSLGEPREIRAAIAREDAAYLSKVVGIGRKTAERVVVELKGKMAEELATLPATARGTGGASDGDVMDALVQLGYKAQEVRDVIRALPTTLATTEEKLKTALQELGRR